MTILGRVLLLINLAAAGAFAFLALLDHSKRLSWTHAVHLHDRAIEGLPVEDQQKELQTLGDVKGANSFFAAVNRAAKKFAKETSDKKEALKSILDSLAVKYKQLQAYQKTLKDIKNKEKLADLLEEAAKRWMLAQALLPLEELRPGAHRELLAAQIADFEGNHFTTPYDKLEQELANQIDELLRPQAENPSLKNPEKDQPGKKAKKEAPSAIELDLICVVDQRGGEKKETYHLEDNTPYLLHYRRIVPDQKIVVSFEPKKKGGNAGVNPTAVTVKLANVEGQPQFELARDGAAFSKKDDSFKGPKVLRGEIGFTANGKQHYVWFAEREDIDYRQSLAYLLFTLAEVMTPEFKPLGVPTEQRVEELVGRKIFLDAYDLQTKAYEQIAERRKIEADHDFDFFVEQYHLLVKERLPYLRDYIERQKLELQRLKQNKTARDKHMENRKAYYEDLEKQLREQRKKATAALKKLAQWQDAVFQAQKAGSGVAEENQRLERKIRKLEQGR
jgi:hypothetical protein